MKITCKNCGNTEHFTLRRELEVEFDPTMEQWNDEQAPAVIREIVICRECDQDQDEVEIVIEE